MLFLAVHGLNDYFCPEKYRNKLLNNRINQAKWNGEKQNMQLTETDIKSSSRNPLVFGLFQRMDMVEQVGSGIKRIKTDVRVAGLPEPVFKTKGIFTIVFERPIEKTVEKTVE